MTWEDAFDLAEKALDEQASRGEPTEITRPDQLAVVVGLLKLDNRYDDARSVKSRATSARRKNRY